MTSNNLVPTPITDKNGKATIVYRSPDSPVNVVGKGLPAPVTTAYVPPKKQAEVSNGEESYEERLRRISHENTRVEGPEEIAAKGKLAITAFQSVGNLMLSAVSEESRSEREDFSMRIGMLGDSGDFAPLILADRFAAVHYTIADATSDEAYSEWDEPFTVDFAGEDTGDWTSDFAGVREHVEIIDLVMSLRENGLMAFSEAPDHGEPRFLAHLYLSASKKLNYRHDDDDTIAFMKIVDEFPEKTETIIEGLDEGLHPEGIRALLDGDLHKGIVSGAL